MKTKVETITPQYALEVLEKHNPRNRTVSDGIVQAYATDMKNGRWVLTHQGLAFDEKGNLIDGQHRLWAVVFSNREVQMNVTRQIPLSEIKNGVEVFAMDTIDRNRPRTVGQQMSLCHGIDNPNNMAAACRAIANIITPNFKGTRISTATSLLIYGLYEKDLTECIRALDKRRQRGVLLGAIAMYHHSKPSRALEFCKQVSTLEGLETGSRLLVRYLEQKSSHDAIEHVSRMTCNSLLYFEEKNNKPQRLTDSSVGREWLIDLFPSVTKQIREALRPCDIQGMEVMRLRINPTNKAKAAKHIHEGKKASQQ